MAQAAQGPAAVQAEAHSQGQPVPGGWRICGGGERRTQSKRVCSGCQGKISRQNLGPRARVVYADRETAGDQKVTGQKALTRTHNLMQAAAGQPGDRIFVASGSF